MGLQPNFKCMEHRIKPPALARVSSGGRFGILLVLFIGFLLVGQLIAVIAVIPMVGVKGLFHLSSSENLSDPNFVNALSVMQIISAAVGFLVPAWLFSWLATRNKKAEYLRVNAKPFGISLFVAALLMICGLPLVNWLGELNAKLPLPQWALDMEEQGKKLVEAFMNNMDTGRLVINLFMIGLLAAVGEEFFFRGCMQRVLVGWTRNVHAGVWITAILFSALHLQFLGFFPRVALGVLLGYMFAWSGSIWVSVFAHFVNNGTAVLLEYFAQQNPDNEKIKNLDRTGMNEGEWKYVLISAVLAAALLLIFYRMEKRRHSRDPLA